jgi:protease I
MDWSAGIMTTLEGKKIAVLAADGFEEAELLEPVNALRAAGAEVEIVAPKGGAIRGDGAQSSVCVSRKLSEADPQDYDALLIPGGETSPTGLRHEDKAVDFAREFVNSDKPVGAIQQGPRLLIDAELVAGRTMTAIESMRPELAKAGARVVDDPVAVDGPIVTGRGVGDLPAFCETFFDKVARMPEASGPKGLVFI